uniref:hypothetical protein n=1 Tax=Armatimonas sp. TaxID=1872638 RepID=UPI00286B6DF7
GGAELPEKLWQAALESKKDPFPLAELSGSASARVQAVWQGFQGRPGPEGAPPPKAPQSVTPRAGLVVQVLCPGLGEAQLGLLGVSELVPQPEAPLVKLPETFKTRGLRVRPPKTPAEAKQLVAQAKARGFTTLYIALSGDANDDRGVGFLAAEKDTLALVPTLSPLMPSPTDSQREHDISVTGRTAAEMAQGRPALSAIAQIMPFIVPLFEQITRLDALTPEAVPVERFADRVARLAALPGVTQIGLHDLAALGYVGENEGGLETLWTGGFSATERLAFLRTQGIDPADFLDVNGFPNTGEFKLPFFSDSEQNGALRNAWNARRKARATQFQKRLDAAFLAAKLTKPLQKMTSGFVMMGNQQWKNEKGGAGPINLPYWEALTRMGPGGGMEDTDETSSIRKWLTQRLTPRATSTSPDTTEDFGFGPSISSTNGFVYDLADLPLAQALTHLETIIAAKS